MTAFRPTVLFICGCLEPGRDGVGDYTRALAAELEGMGIRCGLAAWNDPYVKEPLMDQVGQGQPVLRLPPSGKGRSHLSSLASRLGQPVASLQFVPYSFSPKGVVLGLAGALRSTLPNASWHVMVHEPWSDGGRGGTLRRILVTWIQRYATKSLLGSLKPVAIHTSNSRYASLLGGSGAGVGVLPLFGNIRPVAERDGAAFERLLASVGAERPPSNVRPFTVGMFGTIHPEWDPSAAGVDLRRVAEQSGVPLRLVSVGQMGERGRTAWNTLQRMTGAQTIEFGHRPAATVSSILVNYDIGLSSTPSELLGKSGSAAAMVEHGVPVVATRGVPPAEPEYDGLYHFDGDWGSRWFELATRRPAKGSRLHLVAQRFLASIAPGSEGPA